MTSASWKEVEVGGHASSTPSLHSFFWLQPNRSTTQKECLWFLTLPCDLTIRLSDLIHVLESNQASVA